MIESPRYKKGDLVKIKGEYRICICADEQNAVFAHCTNRGEAIRMYDMLVIHPIHGRYSKKVQHIKAMNPTTLAMRINAE